MTVRTGDARVGERAQDKWIAAEGLQPWGISCWRVSSRSAGLWPYPARRVRCSGAPGEAGWMYGARAARLPISIQTSVAHGGAGADVQVTLRSAPMPSWPRPGPAHPPMSASSGQTGRSSAHNARDVLANALHAKHGLRSDGGKISGPSDWRHLTQIEQPSKPPRP